MHLRFFFLFVFVCEWLFIFSQLLQDSSSFLLRCQRDDQSIQIIFREMLQKETNQLEKDEKRLEKQVQKTLDKLDKLQKKNQKLEKEISHLELDPKVLEGRDHELRVQLDALESTNKSLRNVTNNQKSEFEAMRRAAQEFEDALKVSQVRELVFIHCAEEETVIFNFPFIIAGRIECGQKWDSNLGKGICFTFIEALRFLAHLTFVQDQRSNKNRKKNPTRLNKQLVGIKEENRECCSFFLEIPMDFSSCSLFVAEYLKQELEIHKKKKKPSTGETIMTRVELAVLKQDQERKSEIGMNLLLR